MDCTKCCGAGQVEDEEQVDEYGDFGFMDCDECMGSGEQRRTHYVEKMRRERTFRVYHVVDGDFVVDAVMSNRLKAEEHCARLNAPATNEKGKSK
jgi:hypothetical protein